MPYLLAILSLSTLLCNAELITSDKNLTTTDTINQNILVPAYSQIDSLHTINGNITLRSGVKVKQINSVNGQIEGDTELKVTANIRSVNGNIRLAQGSVVQGSISSISGSIVLNNVLVSGNVTTYHGDIRLSGETIIKGDIIIGAANAPSNTSLVDYSMPTIWISDEVQILGSLVLLQPAELHITKCKHCHRYLIFHRSCPQLLLSELKTRQPKRHRYDSFVSHFLSISANVSPIATGLEK